MVCGRCTNDRVQGGGRDEDVVCKGRRRNRTLYTVVDTS